MTPRRLTSLYIKALTSTWVLVMVPAVLLTSSGKAFKKKDLQVFGGAESATTTASIPASVPAPNVPWVSISEREHGSHLRVLAKSAAHLCGVPHSMFFRLIEVESGWNEHAVSSSGAIGAAQIKPSTLRFVSPTLRPWVASDRLTGAACYLRMMYDRETGDERSRWHRALLSYRYGPNRTHTPSTRYADKIIE